MNRLFLIILTVCSLLVSAAASGADRADMDTCNRLYYEADYEQAVGCYEGLGTSPEILFNIGNSYVRMDRPGYAVLYYLRGLCLAPEDSDLHNNLAQVRREYSLFQPDPSFADRFFTGLTISQWTYACLAVCALYPLFLGFALAKRKSRITIGSTTLLCLLLLAFGIAGARYHYVQWQKSVVVETDRLLVSPFEKAESVGTIAQGRLVSPHKTYRDFVYVIDEAGRKGWLHRTSLQPILPKEE